MKFRINSLLALNRNQILIDPISTIHSKCPLKKYSPRIWYSEFFISFHRHLIHSWLQEKSQNLVFFRHTLYTNKGTNPHHLLSLVARAARCPEKNGKTQEQGRLRPLDPSPGLMIGFATISTSFFSLSLSFFFPSFFLFSSFMCIYIYRQICAQCVPCVTYGSFHFLSSGWPCIHCTTSYALVERIFNKRLNSFMVYL